VIDEGRKQQARPEREGAYGMLITSISTREERLLPLVLCCAHS
jgi:hypothetical protein